MKYANLSTLGSVIMLSVASLATSNALAADPGMPKTRAEVLQELNEAERNGEIKATDLDGWPLNQHPPMTKGPNLTREQVRKELEDAERSGEIQATDLDGWPLDQHPPKSAEPSLTREQVRKEREDAQRNPEKSVWPKSYDN